jgi:D-sedoheptulose 7-phosphate isomerase
MINELLKRYPCLEPIKEQIVAATEEIINCYENGGKLLLCGNGGSCADCEHITGELMKGFLKKRPISDNTKKEMKLLSPEISDEILSKLQVGLPAISLPSLSALNTAFANDVDSNLIYAQGVMSLGKKGDVLIAISTSGNSQNVVAAVKTAKALGIKVIGLTGGNGGELKKLSDIVIAAPETETYKIQELHLPVYHYICAQVEDNFFKI